MEQNFDIELQDSKTEESSQAQLPMNFITFGEIEHDDVKVYIKQDVYKALEKYALADTEHERGTIILGDYHEELGKLHVIISNYIEARYTDASASTLTFTHETWDYVYKQQSDKYPDKKIVGWQHTHPSYGIFLSNYDLFIQENFFNLPFQVAYVIDPVQNIRGFFQWKNGKIEKLKGYYIYDDVGKPIKIEPVKKENNKRNTKKQTVFFPILSVIAAAVAVISLIFMLNMRSALLKQGVELEQTVREQEERLNAFERETTGNETNESTFTAEELLDKIESQQIVLDNQQEIIDDLSETVAELQEGQEANDEYIVYTVNAGDTLAEICKEIGIDYRSNLETILSMNHIADENVIYSGQVLIFPNEIQYN